MRLTINLHQKDVKMEYVGWRYGSFLEEHNVFLMTFQSAKGLDFDNVFIPDVSDRMYISPDPDLSKTTFMVAMTRSRNNLYLCYYGTPHRYLSYFSDSCSNVNVEDQLNDNNSGDAFSF